MTEQPETAGPPRVPPPPKPAAAAPARVRTWHVSMHGEIYGPVDADAMARWAAEGRFGAHCWVRETGSSRWVGAESVPELRRILASFPLPLATFRERFLAQLVDCVIMGVPVLIAFVGAWKSGVGFMGVFPVLNLMFGGTGASLLVVASNDWILTASRGQSLGKILLGIAVVNRQGARPDWNTAAMRTAAKFAGLLLAAIIPFLGLIGVLWFPLDALAMRSSPYRQTYHDRWTNTYVCRLRGGPLGLRGQGYPDASSRR
ncbi:MAG: RDD family protein [Armatimonadota bacterium]